MKYTLNEYPHISDSKIVTNAFTIAFYDDEENYLGNITPWSCRDGEFNLNVVGNKNLRINVLSYKKEPIDTNWVEFGARTSTSTTIKEESL